MNERADMTHDEAALSLPWLVNGTLEGPELQAVEQHVRSCVTCRRELTRQRELRGAVRAGTVLGASRARSFDALMQRIDGAPPPAQTVGASSHDSVLRRRPQALLAMAAGLAGIVLIAGLLMTGDTGDRHQPAFRTLGSDEALPPTGPVLRVVFAETATEEDLRRLLQDHALEIVGGPSDAGVYTLRPVDEGVDLAASIARLRQRPEVIFAQGAGSGDITP